jgi:hypothetical protein
MFRRCSDDGLRGHLPSAALPCQRVITLDTDHSLFLSLPDQLAAHLIALA